MTSRRQIKSLSVTSDPITAGLSEETDVLLDNDYIADAWTYCHVFLDHIWSRRKPVWGLGNDGQEWNMEVEQDHMVMSRRYEGQESDSCHSCMVVPLRRDARESSSMESFLFYFFFNWVWDICNILIYFSEWKLKKGAFLALVFISEALEVINVILLSV